jgi:phosphatidylserine/phosphatidylglycerophosphate/cardiolipin synthase-like enzyme
VQSADGAFRLDRQLIQDDDTAVIGSSNMNIRSFQLDLEVTLVCYGNDVVTELVLQFWSLWLKLVALC